MSNKLFWGRLRPGGDSGPWYIIVYGIPDYRETQLCSWLTELFQIKARRAEEQTGCQTSGFWMGPLRDNTTWVKVVTTQDYDCMMETLNKLPWDIIQGDKRIEIDCRQKQRHTWVLNPHEGDYDETAEVEQENDGPAEAEVTQRMNSLAM